MLHHITYLKTKKKHIIGLQSSHVIKTIIKASLHGEINLLVWIIGEMNFLSKFKTPRMTHPYKQLGEIYLFIYFFHIPLVFVKHIGGPPKNLPVSYMACKFQISYNPTFSPNKQMKKKSLRG